MVSYGTHSVPAQCYLVGTLQRYVDFVNTNTNMGTMFYGCKVFEGVGLDSWNVSKVTKMDTMFTYCEKFDGDLSSWDVSKVVNMDGMFSKCSILGVLV